MKYIHYKIVSILLLFFTVGVFGNNAGLNFNITTSVISYEETLIDFYHTTTSNTNGGSLWKKDNEIGIRKNNSIETPVQNTTYTYRLELSSSALAPQFSRNRNGDLVYSGNNVTMQNFFANYTISTFEQEFPKSTRTNLLNLFLVETTSNKLIDELISKFPSLFLSYTDTTGLEIKILATYPNDYGSTSPVPNLGTSAARTDLDYINAPDAWDLGFGDSNIKIGISDHRIDTSLGDLDNGKVTFTSGYGPTNPNVASHGTTVAALAAAEGNNAEGSAGICADCSIISAVNSYRKLYDIAQAGARVINMSWCSPCYRNETYILTDYDNQNQQVMNEIAEDYGVVLVAASGNRPSFSTPNDYTDDSGNGMPDTPFGVIHVYPANFDNVISVGTVHHFFPLGDGNWANHLIRNQDAASIALNNLTGNPQEAFATQFLPVSAFITPTSPNGLIPQHTVNQSIDILAPGSLVYDYDEEDVPGITPYSSGTSFAAPLVSGTIALMFDKNSCLNVDQVEAILKLTTKDIEHTVMHLGTPFYGNVGAGKLEVGDAVHFTNEMQKIDGIARLENHTFYRFTFDLQNIVNDLVLTNMKFTYNPDLGTSSIVDFKAGHSIKLLPGTLFKPGANGYCKLSIDPNTKACTVSTALFNCFDPSSSDYNCPRNKNKTSKKYSKSSAIKLANNLSVSPNPFTNTIHFRLSEPQDLKNVKFELFDTAGRRINGSTKDYSAKGNEVVYDGSKLNFGLYIYKLTIDNETYTGKIIKN